MRWELWIVLASLLFPAAHVHAMTVRLTEQDAASTVILHVGDRLRVDLPTAPATGFRWAAKTLDASHLVAMGESVRPDNGRLTATGTQVFAWKAISPGQAEIAIAYRRPIDDRTAAPAKRVTLTVEIVAGALAPEDDAPALEKLALYRGAFACDGCLEIAAEVAIYKSGDALLFVERRRYVGAAGGDKTIAGTGAVTVLRGTYADHDATVYVLSAPDGSTENLKLEGDRLVPLDAQMLPVPSPAGKDFVLKKVPESASAP